MPEKPAAPQPEPRPDAIEAAPSALQVVIYDPDGTVLHNQYARLRKYSTGSWGYHTAGKIDLPRVPGKKLQINVGMTVIGSKTWNKKPE